VKILHYFFKQYGLMNKILAYAKHENYNLNIIIVNCKLLVSICETLGVDLHKCKT